MTGSVGMIANDVGPSELSRAGSVTIKPAAPPPRGSSVDLLIQLSELVAMPGVRASFLTRDNEASGYASVRDAALSGRPYFVRVADQILAVDFDHEDAAIRAERLYWTCRMEGISALLLASGQPGRRHVFAWPGNARLHEQLNSIGRQLGGDVRLSIRPPLAPHRLDADGVRPHLLRPARAEEVLTLVHEFAPGNAWSKTMQDKTFTGVHRYRSRSEFLRAVALAAVNGGWSLEETQAFLAAKCSAAGTAYQGRIKDRGEQETHRWFKKYVWPGAVEKAETSPARRQDPDPLLVELLRQVAQMPWSGRRSSDHAVYMAILEKATMFGGIDVHASRRELMERAGLRSVATVERALGRLERDHYIKRVPYRGPKDPSGDGVPVPSRRSREWRLLARTPPPPRGEPRKIDLDVAAAGRHDAFQNGAGLGKNAHRVWAALHQAPGTDPKTMASSLGIGVRTVRKHLIHLAAFEMVTTDSADHWWPALRDLESVAYELGTLGNGARQALMHERERWAYDEAQEDRRREFELKRRGTKKSI